MQVTIPGGWLAFCIALAIVLITSFIMNLLGKFFVTRDVVLRDFTILDLELASTELEIDNTFTGIKKLDEISSRKVLNSLRMHLYVDFLFMPAAYGAIFIGCMQLSTQMPKAGIIFFTSLAWLQIAAWLSDIAENIYLLQKINQQNKQMGIRINKGFFSWYQYLQVVKWGASLLALVCVLSAIFYFWLSGYYSPSSLKYILVVAGELVLFIVLVRIFSRTGRGWRRALSG